MHISENGLKLIEQFEGYSATPYWDHFGRVWTRGYGETEGIGPNSPRLTPQEAENNLRRLVQERYEPSIAALGVELNQNQWDALCSFAWNLGAGIFTGELRDALERHDWQSAASQMLLYDHAGGQVLEGLARRRRIEAALFLEPAAEPAYVNPQEANWIREWDRIRARRTPAAHARRLFLKRQMIKRRQRIWRLAQQTGWQELNRAARYRQLLARTEG